MRRTITLLALVLSLFLFVENAYATTYYVRPGGNNTTGLDWTNAKTTIQAAVDLAADNDVIYVEGYYDGTNTAAYAERVNIPATRNGLQVIGVERLDDNTDWTTPSSGREPVLDGNGMNMNTYAVNGFYVRSDNVTIQYFVIQNYDDNTDNTTSGIGAGIITANSTSTHTFQYNTFMNCAWGVFLQNNVGCTIDNNTFKNIHASSGAGTGGVAVRVFTASGNSISGTNVTNNTFAQDDGLTAAECAIWVGGTTAANAEFSNIDNNSIEYMPTGKFAVRIQNVINSISLEENSFNYNWSNLLIEGQCLDLYVANNTFWNTVSSYEVVSDATYSGYMMYQIMVDNGNDYAEGDISLNPSACGSLEWANDAITDYLGERYIRNIVDDAVTDAENYLSGAPTQARVYVLDGLFTDTDVSVAIPTTEELKIFGQSTNAVLQNTGTIFTLTGADASIVDINTLTIQPNTTAANRTAIDVQDCQVNVEDCIFSNTGSANYYDAILATNANVDGLYIHNNNFDSRIHYGVWTDFVSTTGTVEISCNTFGMTNGTGVNAIRIIDENADNVAMGDIHIYGNTINSVTSNYWANDIYIAPGSGTAANRIKIGKQTAPYQGNSLQFFGGGNAINVVSNPAAVGIMYNKFLPNGVTTGKAVVNATAVALNASWNNWGVAQPYATNIPGEIGGAGALNVNWLPILTSATDQSGDCGFQPDVTQIWAPIYTSINETDVFGTATNEYFLTIQNAIDDLNTGSADHYYVNLYDAAFTENVDVTPGAGGSVYIRKATDFVGTVTVTPAAAGATFAVNTDGTALKWMVIDGLTILSFGTATTDYPINGVGLPAGTGQQYLKVINCDITTNNTVNVWGGIHITGNTNVNHIYIYNNQIHFYSGGAGIYFQYADANSNASYIDILNNTVTCLDFLGGTSIGFTSAANHVNIYGNSNVQGYIFFASYGDVNTDYVNIGAFGTDPTYGFLLGNTFNNSTGINPTGGIVFDKWGGGTSTFASNSFNIKQNYFNGTSYGVYFRPGFADADINLNNLDINQNYFKGITDAGGAIYANFASAETIDATNNYWDSPNGPEATALAPAWSELAGNLIISNAYNYGDQGTLLIDYQNNIDFVRFWQDIAGVPGNYSGTSFAPIVNNEVATKYFASLNFAVDGTTTGSQISIVAGNFTEEGRTELDANDVSPLNIVGALSGSTPTTYFNVINNTNAQWSVGENNADEVNISNIIFDGGLGLPDGNDIIDYNNGAYGVIDNIQMLNLDNVAGIWINGTTPNEVTIQNSTFNGGLAQTIHPYDGAIVNVLNCDITNEGVGFYIYQNNDVSVQNCNITYSESHAIQVSGNNNTLLIGTVTGNVIDNNTGSGTIFAGSGNSLTIENNDYTNNNTGIYIWDATATFVCMNNNISSNYVGMYNHTATAYTADRNWWGHDNGPINDYNVFNVGSQGDLVSEDPGRIDYCPWRMTNKMGTPFCPIVRTNSGDAALDNYSNFTDAIAAAAPTNRLYAHEGVYTEHATVNVASLLLNGKATGDYNTWIVNPASHANPWTVGTAGVTGNAPQFVYDGANTQFVTIAANNTTVQGFNFDLTGIPTSAVDFSGPVDYADFHFNNFTMDGGWSDFGIQVNGNTNVTYLTADYNTFTGPTNGQANWFSVGLPATGGGQAPGTTGPATLTNNVITQSRSTLNLDDDRDVISQIAYEYNTFNQTPGAILLDESVSYSYTQFDRISVKYNTFNNGSLDEYAVNLSQYIVEWEGDIATNWPTDLIVYNNNILLDPNDGDSYPAVGFQYANPEFSNGSMVDARCNYWGHVNGPINSHNPVGTGATVSDMCTFTPWSTSAGAPWNCDGWWVFDAASSRGPAVNYYSCIADGLHNAADVNPYIYVKSTYPGTESLDIYSLTGAGRWIGTYPAGGTVTVTDAIFTGNDNSLTLEDDMNMTGDFDLTGGTNNKITLGVNDLSLEGNVFNWIINPDNNCATDDGNYVVTDDTGYFILTGLYGTGNAIFPIGNNSNEMGFELSESQNVWLSSNKQTVKARVRYVDPTLPTPVGKGVGDPAFSLWALYDIQQVTTPVTNQNITLNFHNPCTGYKTPIGVTETDGQFDFGTSYGAKWNGTEWVSYRNTSSWYALGGYTSVGNITTLDNDWAIFSGTSSAGCTTPPSTQARNIVFTTKTPETISLWWIKGNGSKSTVIVKPATAYNTNSITDLTFTNDVPYDGYKATIPGTINTFTDYEIAHPTSGTTARIAYDGTGNTCIVRGLTSGQYYTFMILTSNGNIADDEDYRNYKHNYTDIEDLTEYGYNPKATSLVYNPRTTMTKPRVTIALDPANVALAGGAMNGNDAYFCEPNPVSYPNTYANILKFTMTGDANSPTGWTIKYTKVGSSTYQVTPNPNISPVYRAASINPVAKPSDYSVQYSLVSATDGRGTLCELSGTPRVYTHEQPGYGFLATAVHGCEDGTTSVTVNAITGYPTPTLLNWERWNGASWDPIEDDDKYDFSSATGSFTLTINSLVYPDDNNAQFRAVLTNNTTYCVSNQTWPSVSDHTVYATVTVYERVNITEDQDVEDVEACDGTTATFSSLMPTDPSATEYIWEYSTDDYTWNTIHQGSGSWSDATYTITVGSTITMARIVDPSIDNYYYRVGYRNSTDCSFEYGNSGQLTVTLNPSDMAVNSTWDNNPICAGSASASTMIVTASNFDKAVWQYRQVGGGAFTDINTSGESEPDVVIPGFGTANVVVASGTTSIALTELTNVIANPDWEFQIVFSNGGVPCTYSWAIPDAGNKLGVDPSIDYTTQPTDQEYCFSSRPATISYTIATNPAATYQWQYNTPGNPSTWTDLLNGGFNGATISGATTVTLSIAGAPVTMHGYGFRCLASAGTCNNVSSNVTILNMYTLSVTNNPSSTQGCAGGTASFSATATSNATFNDPGAANTYKVNWQRWTGSTWTNLTGGTLPGGSVYSGNTSNTLQLSSLNSSDNGIQLRAKYIVQTLYDGDLACSETNTNGATLTVNTVPATTALSCTDFNALDFTVSWAPITSATMYELEVWNAAENVRYVNTIIYAPETSRTINASDFAIARGTTYRCLIRVYNNCGRSPWSSWYSVTTLNPQIARTGTGTLDFGSLTNPDCSTPQTFVIGGTQLESSAGIALTAPTYYTMSTTSGGSYTSTLNLTATGTECTGWTVANTTIYVKFCPPTECGTYAGNVTNTSTNATGINVAVTGIGLTPAPDEEQIPTDITFASDDGSTVVGSLTINNSTGSDNRRIILTAYKDDDNQWSDAPPVNPWTPTNGTTYTVGDEFGYSGWNYEVVAVNTADEDSFTASDLDADIVYWFLAYEYNTCSGAQPVYNTTLPGYASNNPNQIKKFTISVTEGTWTPLSGTAFAAVVTAIDRVDQTLAYHEGVTYNLTRTPADGTFNFTGTSIADGNASNTSNVTWTVTNGEVDAYLTATRTGGSLGWFAGNSNEFNLYCTEPANQDQVIYFTNVTSVCTNPRYSYMTIGWVRGVNTPVSNSLVLMKAGSTPTLPTDGDELGEADRNFTNAPSIPADANTKVIWYGTGTTVSTVTALQPDVTYHVKLCATYGGYPVTGSTTDGGYTTVVTNYKTSASTFNPNTRRTPACRQIALSNSTEVSSFRAASYSSKVMTTWKTESEYDNAGFELYRLCVDDGSSEFVKVSSYQTEPNMVGMANSSSGKDYSYLDKDIALQIGKTYLYKLVNVSYDGTVTEQSETLVTILGTTLLSGATLDLSAVKPNPATTEVKFTVTLSAEQIVNIEVLDMTGRKVLEPANNMTLGEGMHEFTMPLPETLSSGFYTIHVTAGTNSELQKFMLVR